MLKCVQIESVFGMGKNIVMLMNDMLVVLEEFVELDMLFFEGECCKCVLNLKFLMNCVDVMNVEKYCWVFEVYQIENDYGCIIEVFDGKFGEGEDVQIVMYLKVGWVVYFYQIWDGLDFYVYNNEIKGWDKLLGDYDILIIIVICMVCE